MVTGMSKHLVVVSETNEQAMKVIEILRQSKAGLTSAEIVHRLGGRMRRNLLALLQKEGKVEQTRGMLADGRIRFLYVLNKHTNQ